MKIRLLPVLATVAVWGAWRAEGPAGKLHMMRAIALGRTVGYRLRVENGGIVLDAAYGAILRDCMVIGGESLHEVPDEVS